MRFPVLKGGTVSRLAFPTLDGGLNLRDGAHRIADNQLADGDNLWWDRGALRTRPGLSPGPEDPRPQSAGTTRLFSREPAFEQMGEGISPVRRFVERAPADGQGIYTLGALSADGSVSYTAPVALPGGTEGPLANTHGLAVDAGKRVLVFFGCGRIYERRDGALADITDEAYVPRLLFGAKGVARPGDLPPEENGVHLESRNLLTGKFRSLFYTDGKASAFYLPLQGLDDSTVTVTLTGASGAAVTHTIPAGEESSGLGADGYNAHINRETGCVHFTDSGGGYAAPPWVMVNNLEVVASKGGEEERDRLFGMTFHTWFDGDPSVVEMGSRLFLGGNPRYPNLVHWSHFNNPLYFPEYNFSTVGEEDDPLSGFGRQGDTLVLFKERSIYGVNYVLRPYSESGDAADSTAAGAYFPMVQLDSCVGCRCPQSICLCGGRLLWADVGRVYMMTAMDSYSRCNVRRLSSPVEPALREYAEASWRAAWGAAYENIYLLAVEHEVYVLRTEEAMLIQIARSTTDALAESRLAWYHWTLPGGVWLLGLVASEKGAAFLAGLELEDGEVSAGIALGGKADVLPGRAPLAIDWRLATKEIDGGTPEIVKALLAVYAGIEEAEGEPVRLILRTEAGIVGEEALLPEEGAWLRRLPGLRARRFGVSLEGRGGVSLDGLALHVRG